MGLLDSFFECIDRADAYYKRNPLDINGKPIYEGSDRANQAKLRQEVFGVPVAIVPKRFSTPHPVEVEKNNNGTNAIDDINDSLRQLTELAKAGAFRPVNINISVNNPEEAQELSDLLGKTFSNSPETNR